MKPIIYPHSQGCVFKERRTIIECGSNNTDGVDSNLINSQSEGLCGKDSD
jgi:hypothetical protein